MRPYRSHVMRHSEKSLAAGWSPVKIFQLLFVLPVLMYIAFCKVAAFFGGLFGLVL